MMMTRVIGIILPIMGLPDGTDEFKEAMQPIEVALLLRFRDTCIDVALTDLRIFPPQKFPDPVAVVRVEVVVEHFVGGERSLQRFQEFCGFGRGWFGHDVAPVETKAARPGGGAGRDALTLRLPALLAGRMPGMAVAPRLVYRACAYSLLLRAPRQPLSG
jgi:hypothetical protein